MRNKIIIPENIGKKYMVDTGRKEKKEILVKLEHIGFKFGELVMTRVPKIPPVSKKKLKTKKKA